jgi:hypothetical protein
VADPKHAEPLHGAMDHCRRNNNPRQGYLIGKHAIGIPERLGVSFVAPWIYDYGVLEEFSVAAAYQLATTRTASKPLKNLWLMEKFPKARAHGSERMPELLRRS